MFAPFGAQELLELRVQFRSVAGWEAVGAGEGAGEDPVGEALAEVRGFSGGTLPAGSYQVIQARSSVTRWETFELGVDGEILDPAESGPTIAASTGQPSR
jgi:hypothetical protein